MVKMGRSFKESNELKGERASKELHYLAKRGKSGKERSQHRLSYTAMRREGDSDSILTREFVSRK